MLEIEVIPMWRLLALALAFLAPWGVALLIASAYSRTAGRRAIYVPLAAFALAMLAYYAAGFALHFGGIGLLYEHPDLDALVWEWSALNENWGATWGMAGLAGFGLVGAQTQAALLLYLSALPAATTAVILTMLALQGRGPTLLVVLMGGLMAGLGYPLLGNWTEGGGWLANLGINIGAGKGFIDFGHSALFLLGGGVALAVMLAFVFQEPAAEGEKAPAASSWWAVLGAGLLLFATTGWLLNQPLIAFKELSPLSPLVNILLAAAAGSLAPLLYTWIAQAHPDPLLLARGVAAGWVAGLASAPFTTPKEAVLVGAGAGLILMLATVVLRALPRFQDPGGIVATFGLPAFWGLLAVGIFAPAPGQLLAQSIGATIITLLAFTTTSILIVPLAVFTSARGARDTGSEDDGADEGEAEELSAPLP